MKSRLFVVNEETLAKAIDEGIASLFMPELSGLLWGKTVADLMADMLQIEIGDYIFFWETKGANNKNRIHGVYRAISKPYYACSDANDTAPWKIKIEKAFDFQKPIDEYDVLNNYHIKNDLWTIVGKKVAQKPRGTTPLSPKESEFLITLLAGLNPDAAFIPWDSARTIDVSNPLTIDYSSRGANHRPSSLSAFDPNQMNFFKENGNVIYEKVLETIFNKEMTNKNTSFFAPFGIDPSKVIWYSNYLPYSLEGSEIDYLIIESEDGIHSSKVYVIDFIKEALDVEHIRRVLLYSKWVNETLCLGSNIVNPMIICKSSLDFINGERNERKYEKQLSMNNYISYEEKGFKTKPLEIYTYDFRNGPAFEKKR